jgi:hypothetical protein
MNKILNLFNTIAAVLFFMTLLSCGEDPSNTYNVAITGGTPAAISDYTTNADNVAFSVTVKNLGDDIPSNYRIVVMIVVTNKTACTYKQVAGLNPIYSDFAPTPLKSKASTNVAMPARDISSYGTSGLNYFYAFIYIVDTGSGDVKDDDTGNNVYQFNSVPAIKTP